LIGRNDPGCGKKSLPLFSLVICFTASLFRMVTPMIDRMKEPGGKSSEAQGQRDNTVNQSAQGNASSSFAAPSISLPKGGGAIRGIGEKFASNPVTGTGSMTVPIAVSPGRTGFGPQLALSYDSGAGNGPFGLGWNLSLPAITRKTDKGLPKYQDADESDIFILSGAEDLVPVLDNNGKIVETERDGYCIKSYRPRIEGLFARIERCTKLSDGDVHWRSISKDNLLTIYGKDQESRIFDPLDPHRIFSWLICETRDDKGNGIVYEYVGENAVNVELSQANEANRGTSDSPLRAANRYIKRIRYGNRTSLLDTTGKRPLFLTGDALADAGWMFEVVIDYGDEKFIESLPDAEKRVFVQSTISATPGQSWSCRRDPFSTYRSGFEVRTYRLCRRTLMYHHFKDELGVDDYLVRSTEFAYDEKPIASFITAITQSGYVRQQNGSYLKRSLPPVEFEYSKAEIQNEVRDLDAESLENLPAGLDGANYQWIDLDGDGVAGVLTEQAGVWFYKRNLSPISTIKENGDTQSVAKLAPVEAVAVYPSFNGITRGGMQFLDLAGDGRPDLVQFDGPAPGFFEHTDENVWEPYQSFTLLPNVNWRDPNLKFVDLTGDGHTDILISDDEVLTWYPSLGEEGFGPSLRVQNAFNEEKGPRLVFADTRQSVFLADLSGDGLTDIVRICNGEVCYWPNLGYGRFGAKVTMDNSPWFDAPDIFDQRRIRLADIDGSGVTDIIYLDSAGIHIYFNQSGNSWSEARKLDVFPTTDNLSSVTVVDLLGNGTACLVWSSPLPGHVQRPMLYVDLMGGQKPHLMTLSKNNLGAETHVHYAPSTKFYLEDKYSGKPWLTKLPFPVHAVERVETVDYISRNRFVTRYAYHHGYFDGEEREFRGFGMVEQWDTEEIGAVSYGESSSATTNLDAASFVQPIHTKTWFHTGVYLGRNRISNYFSGLVDANDVGEYYREPGWTDDDTKKYILPDTVFPPDLTLEEEREACRSLKGAMLRQEVYGLDGTDKAQHPYTITEQNFTIKRLQPQGGNRHAVFFTHAREAINYHYERNPADSRIAHTMTLEVDPFGNVLKQAAIGYGRLQPDVTLSTEDQLKQTQTFITYTENRVTNAIDVADNYRTPLPCESRSYELTGLVLPAGRSHFSINEMLNAGAGAVPISYEQNPTPGVLLKRLIEHMRTLYRPDDFGVAQNDPLALLSLGTMESLALLGESYKLAFTPGLLAGVYGARTSNAMLDTECRYVHSEGDTNWWVPSGRMFFSPGSTDTPAQEANYARQHFFLPHRYRNPFHTNAVPTESFVIYDSHDLLMMETRDALGNRVTVGERDAAGNVTASGNDYRVLQPRLIMDPNRNRATVAFDSLGMVVGTAVMGKPLPAPVEGDSLDSFDADLTEAVILDHLANPLANPQTILQHATTRLVYDVFAYQRTKNQPDPQPAVVYTLARETHDSDPVPVGGLKIQHSFSYSDGFAREMQKKIQAEPGPVPKRDTNGKIIVDVNGQPEMTRNDVNPRWVGTGWTVFNNKGKPVRQYEPFFTDTQRFEFDLHIGVSPVLFYDPVERVVATLHPNHTWEKVVFDPWRQEIWDVNDTVLVADPKTDPNVGEFFARLQDADYLPTWYAQRQGGALGPQEQAAARKAAIHAATPAVAHADSLGRTFLTVAHNKFKFSDTPLANPPVEEFHRTRVILDIEGNQRAVRDAIVQNGDQQGRVVMRHDYDMLGNRIHQASMEAGERWMLNDVAGKPLYAWDSRNHQFRTACDQLRRPTDSFLREGAGAELLVGRTVYGETRPNPEANNLRGKVVQLFDQAGVVTTDDYDFEGNLLRSQRQLAQRYNITLNWSLAVPLEADIYTSHTRYDALKRPTELTAPDNSVIRPGYNEANLLERVEANLRGSVAATLFVADIDYDAQGQRTLIDYGNGVRTTYTYDPLTFRLTRLLTRRDAVAFPDDCPQLPPAGWPGCQVQNLHYTYDPAGNITYIRDDAQQTVYFSNRRVEPSAEYTYDAVYRLIEATGREHLGQVGGSPIPHSYNDVSRLGLLHPNDGNAMGRYIERYVYDAVGNFQEMIHRGSDPANPGWTRVYSYNDSSLLELGKQSNRLTSMTVGGMTETYSVGGNGYDAHGNMLRMPQLQIMRWDFKDQLQMTQRQAVNAADADGVQHQGERTWYVYDPAGQRVRKVTETSAGQIKEERIYLGGFEIYRRNGANQLVREALHITDDKQRIALVETRTLGNAPGPQQLIRYQFGNHLGSASLELDDQAQVISYEEYTPYGGTSYQAVRNQTETPKRYRYTGKERDKESGLYYHGARYYAPWLGRWTTCDPAGLVDGPSLFVYVSNNPIRLTDPTGRESADDRVVSLSPWRQEGRWTGAWPPSVPPTGPIAEQLAQSFSQADAARNTRLQPMLLTNIPGWRGTWASLGPIQGLPSGQYSGLASGVGVQQVFEGGIARSIHFDVTGVQVLGRGQTPSELRNVITTLQTGGNQNVDVHIYENGQVSTIPRGSTQVVGAPLPERIAKHLPNLTPPAAPSGSSPPPSTGSTAPSGGSLGSRIATGARSAATSVRSAVGSAATGVRTAVSGAAQALRNNPRAALAGAASATGGALARTFIPGATEVLNSVAAVGVRGTATFAAPLVVAAAGAAAGYVVGDAVETYVTRETGNRTAGVAAGTGAGVLAGAAAGAAVGAAIGALGFGVGAVPGAAIGAAAGAVAGFIGAYW
jgi:RHS repeat-associated protein